MKKAIEKFSPVSSDLELMFLITNLYLEQGRAEYREDIENVIRTTRELVLEKIKAKDIAPEIFSIVTALKAHDIDYFKHVQIDHIDKPAIETLRSMLSTLRHSRSY